MKAPFFTLNEKSFIEYLVPWRYVHPRIILGAVLPECNILQIRSTIFWSLWHSVTYMHRLGFYNHPILGMDLFYLTSDILSQCFIPSLCLHQPSDGHMRAVTTSTAQEAHLDQSQFLLKPLLCRRMRPMVGGFFSIFLYWRYGACISVGDGSKKQNRWLPPHLAAELKLR
jgi:hypothetical protein